MARKTIKVERIVESMVYDYFQSDRYERKAMAYLSDDYICTDGGFTPDCIELCKSNMNMHDYFHDRYRALLSLLLEFIDYDKYDAFTDDVENALCKGLEVGNEEVSKYGVMEVWNRLD